MLADPKEQIISLCSIIPRLLVPSLLLVRESSGPVEIEERFSQPSGEMAGAESDPMSDLVALLRYEERQEARQALSQVVNDWENLQDKLENYTVDDINSSHDSEECVAFISEVRRDQEAMQPRINRTAALMPKLPGEDVSGGEKLLNIKNVIRTEVRVKMNLLRERLGQLKAAAAGTGAGAGAEPAGGGGVAAHFQIYQDPPAGNNTVLAKVTARSNSVLDDGRVLLSDMQEIDIYAVEDTDVTKAMKKIEDSQKKEQCEWMSTGRHVSNVGLMAQKSDKTSEIPTANTVIVTDQDGQQIFSQEVKQGDIWRMCQAKDISVQSFLDLGRKTDDEATKTFTTVSCLFHKLYGKQILGYEDQGEPGLKNVLSLVVKFRCEAQQWLLALRGRL